MVSGGGCPFAETVQVVDQYCNYFHKPADGAFGEALVVLLVKLSCLNSLLLSNSMVSMVSMNLSFASTVLTVD
jgi:hypothetical protein